MDFDTWWRVTGQLDEGGKDDWRECWDAAIAADRKRLIEAAEQTHWAMYGGEETFADALRKIIGPNV